MVGYEGDSTTISVSQYLLYASSVFSLSHTACPVNRNISSICPAFPGRGPFQGDHATLARERFHTTLVHHKTASKGSFPPQLSGRWFLARSQLPHCSSDSAKTAQDVEGIDGNCDCSRR